MAPRLCSCHWLLLSSVLWNVAAFPSFSSSSSSSSFSANRKEREEVSIYRKYHPGIAICNCIFSDLLSASVLFVPKPQFHFVFCILYFFSRLPSLPLSVLHLSVCWHLCWHLISCQKFLPFFAFAKARAIVLLALFKFAFFWFPFLFLLFAVICCLVVGCCARLSAVSFSVWLTAAAAACKWPHNWQACFFCFCFFPLVI